MQGYFPNARSHGEPGDDLRTRGPQLLLGVLYHGALHQVTTVSYMYMVSPSRDGNSIEPGQRYHGTCTSSGDVHTSLLGQALRGSHGDVG